MPSLPDIGSTMSLGPGRRSIAVRILAALAAVLLVASGCAAIRTADDGSAPPVAPVTVTLGGREWTLLRDPGIGMRFRADFGGADGMLFDMLDEADPSAVVFVMDDVPVPLDIAWFDAAGVLVGVAHMDPCEDSPCRTYAAPRPFRWAVEAPVGALDFLRSDDRLIVPVEGLG
ncbi:MAG TPA: DUF192 domain-containing protein [Candidatus Saccharimonadales bacterium]|nr:DUF192 domain-containing protein [Candidatus Saccharimonadales bacterium]